MSTFLMLEAQAQAERWRKQWIAAERREVALKARIAELESALSEHQSLPLRGEP